MAFFMYLSAPAALLFLLLATVDAAWGGGFAAAMLGGGAGGGLVVLGAVLLYAGKVTSLLAALADPEEAAGYGGRLTLLGSAVAEQLAAFVVSALLIVSYSRFVLDLVLGRSVRWDAQPRDDRGVGWREGWARMWAPTLLGVVWAAALPVLPGAVTGWSLPLVAGLLGTLPLTVWSSRTSWGRGARRVGLLVTPEEGGAGADPAGVAARGAGWGECGSGAGAGGCEPVAPRAFGGGGAVMRALLLVMALLLPAGAAGAQVTLGPGDGVAIERVIRGQMDAFGRDDAAGAYRYAAPNVRQVFPTAEGFLDMVRRGYAPVYRPRQVEFSELAVRNGVVVQDVELVGPDGRAVTAAYTLERDGQGGWVITGCSLLPSVRATT